MIILTCSQGPGGRCHSLPPPVCPQRGLGLDTPLRSQESKKCSDQHPEDGALTQLVLELQIGEFFEKWVIQVLEVWRTGQAFQAGKGSSAVLLLLVLHFLLQNQISEIQRFYTDSDVC